jgi:hypothetical protein
MNPGKVLISGGTGLVGRKLSALLLEKGYRVAILSRDPKPANGISEYYWDPGKGIMDPEAIKNTDFIVHLAGVKITGRRWTSRRKRMILKSRLDTANLLYKALIETGERPGAFISASAVGYYGTATTDRVFTEQDPASGDFLGATCVKWEKAADQFRSIGIRTVIIRAGVILAEKGTLLQQLHIPLRMGLVAAVGTGRQYVPWIHITDLCNIYIKAIGDTALQGAYNAVAPEHITNKTFVKTLAQAYHKSVWIPNVPAIFLKIAVGEMSKIALEGNRVSSQKIRLAGFNFKFPDLKSALKDLLKIHPSH